MTRSPHRGSRHYDALDTRDGSRNGVIVIDVGLDRVEVNVFDELKNQWGWGGFVTHDLARSRLAARLVALFYNWWNIFTRFPRLRSLPQRPRPSHATAPMSILTRPQIETPPPLHERRSEPSAEFGSTVQQVLHASAIARQSTGTLRPRGSCRRPAPRGARTFGSHRPANAANCVQQSARGVPRSSGDPL